MALTFTRAAHSIRSQGTQKLGLGLGKLLTPKINNTFGCCKVLTASLYSVRGETIPRPKPYPYKKLGRHSFFLLDRDPGARFDENSKIIVVDGNIATGKNELAKKIANEFDMLYVPEVTMDEMYTGSLTNDPYHMDIRELDPRLTPKAKSCDLETFYSQKAPKYVLDNFSRSQYTYFRHKMFNWAKTVMAHILNTGQGVVMTRGMYSDLVWAHALTKTGYMRPPALKEYMTQYKNLVNYFWYPHLVIYIDAPVDMVKDRIKKRAVPWEVNSPVITDDYLNAIRDAYKNEYMPLMERWCETLTLDLADGEIDFDELSLVMQQLDLDGPPIDDRSKKKLFHFWAMISHSNTMKRNFMMFHRRLCTPVNNKELTKAFEFWPPFDAPELMIDQMDAVTFNQVLESDDRYKWAPSWAPGNMMNYFRLG